MSMWILFPVGLVGRDRFLHQRLERRLVDLLAFADVEAAPHVALEARGEELLRVLERRALREGELHVGLVGLAGADDAVVRPDGTPHFHSSTTPGSAALMSLRIRARASPRQSPRLAIRSSISSEAGGPAVEIVF